MLTIILNETRRFLRTGSSFFFHILFPSLLVFFLGTLLEKIEVSDETIGELSIVYSIENAEVAAKFSFEEFIENLEKEKVLTAYKTEPLELQNTAAGYSAGVLLNGTDITIYNGSDTVKNRAVKMLFDSYLQTAETYMTAAAVNPYILSEIQYMSEESYISQKDLGVTRSMMDYYAVAMIVMIVFMGSCIGGGSSYSDEHRFYTIDRLNISPVSPTAVYFGKIIGSLPMVLIQILTVMITSTVLFGAHYCTDFSGNLLLMAMFVSTSLAVLAVGILLNLFIPRLPAMLIFMPVLWILMFYSGTFAKDIYIKGFSDRLPMYRLQKAAFDLTIFSRPEKAVHAIAVSLLIFAVLILIGTIKVNIRRKRA